VREKERRGSERGRQRERERNEREKRDVTVATEVSAPENGSRRKCISKMYGKR